MSTTGFTFSRGVMRKLERQMEARREEILATARGVMLRAVEEGAVALQDQLELADTKTGRRRELLYGGFPGRHDTGNMVGSIDYDEGKPFEVDGDVEIYAFGWYAGQFEDYFYAQDVGEGRIPAARGLEVGYARAIQVIRQNMPKAVA